MKDTDKVTLTVGQIKRLVSEAKAKKQNVNEDSDGMKRWKRENRQLTPVKREIAKKGKELYNQFCEKFIATMSKDFIKNKLSFHSDRPQDAAEQFLESLMDGETMSVLTGEMYLFDDGSFDD